MGEDISKILLHGLEKSKFAMKKSTAQSSISTHPDLEAEAQEERAEIITTFYTANACANAAIFADSSKVKGFTLGHRGKAHRRGWRSVAFLRSSEEDVYFRNDSMTVEGISK